MAAAALSSMPFVGYVATRLTGLPGDTGDIGNWTQPLGLASLAVEACVFAVSMVAVTRTGKDSREALPRRPLSAGV